MARLQDFQTVTPTSSDNMLIVQSQGQGLATVETLRQKMAGDTNLGDLKDSNISGATNGQVPVFNGTNNKWENKTLDTIPKGSHTVYGIWSSTYYSTCRMWVAFPNANKYTITLTSAKYRSANTTMTSLPNATIAATNDCGFLVSSGNDVPINQYGEVQFTTA